MSHLKFPVTEHVKAELLKHGVRRGSSVKVQKESYEKFMESIQAGGYSHLSAEQKHALAIGCCMTHPDHRDKHRRIPHYWYWVAAAVATLVLLGISARAQGTSQIDVIKFQSNAGSTVGSVATPFTFKAGANCTLAKSGSTITFNCSGGAGGGYSTIQNAGVAIAQEAAINFLGSFSCVDNAANGSSDCQLTQSAAVAHQFVTGVDSSGNYLRAAILAADVPTLNQNTSGNAATATALAANPTDCSSGQYANAIDASGNLTCAQVGYSQIGSTPVIPITKTCTGTDKVSAYDSATGLFVCSADQTGGGSTPTGTGFRHVTSGTEDAAAVAVDVSSADVTGVLAASAEPAHTGDVTNSAGSLATTIASGAVTRAKLAADAIGWQFLCTNTSTSSTITCTASTARKHNKCNLTIGGYSGGGGVARYEMGNASTVDTGSNYGWAGFNLVSGTSTAPTVSGIGSGSTAQEGCPVSGSTTTAGRDVWVEIDNRGAAIKYGKISEVGIGASAAVTPNLAEIGCTWNNTTDGIGVFQFKACSATTGACSTVNFTATTTLTCWGRDDN